jgi:hypothetical protein
MEYPSNNYGIIDYFYKIYRAQGFFFVLLFCVFTINRDDDDDDADENLDV